MMQPINDILYYIESSFIWVLKRNHINSERSNQMKSAEIDWLYPTVHMKDQVLGNVLGAGLFRTPSDRISYRIHIVRTSCSQLSARYGMFCFLVEAVYWPCGLKFLYPTINLAFLELIVKVKLPVKFCLHRFEWFSPKISFLFFLSRQKHCDQRLIVVIVY